MKLTPEQALADLRAVRRDRGDSHWLECALALAKALDELSGEMDRLRAELDAARKAAAQPLPPGVPPPPPSPSRFALWKYFNDYHCLTLIESELDDIIAAVQTYERICAYCGQSAETKSTQASGAEIPACYACAYSASYNPDVEEK
jgi:hypothetical protein